MFASEDSFNVLYTTDIPRTQSFFEQLNVPIKESSNEKVVVTLGSFELHYVLNTSEPFKEYEYIATPNGYGQGVIFYIETTDLQKISEQIPQAGGALKSPIFKNKWDCNELLAEDPNGYKFAFYQE